MTDPSSSSPAPWWRLWLLPLCLLVLFMGGQLFIGLHHEMWRDEIQAWLLARDTPWPWQIFHAIRYEGHPGLWHLLLWLPSQLSWNPAWMQVIHSAMAGVSALLWWRHSPLPWWLRVPLPFGYFFFYEYGVIARNYAISVLLLFLICHRLRQGLKGPVGLGLLVALLCHSNVHSMIVVMGTLPWAMVIFWWHRRKDRYDAHSMTKRVALGFAIAVVGLGTAVIQVKPPADTGFASKWVFEWQGKRAERISRSVVHAYAPVPSEKVNFWNGNTFFDSRDGLGWWQAGDGHWLAGIVLLLGSVCLLSRPFLLLPYWSVNLGLWTFFYIKYPGSYRHHGFFMLVWVTLLWLSVLWRRDGEGICLHHRAQRVLMYLIVLVWSALGVWGTWVAADQDRVYPFSNGEAAGHYIRDNFKADVMVTGDQSAPQLSTLVGHAQLPFVYYVGREDWGSYLIWDSEWSQRRRRSEVLKHTKTLLTQYPDREMVFVSGRKRSTSYYRYPGLVFELVGEFSERSISHEQYVLYQVRRTTDAQAPTPK